MGTRRTDSPPADLAGLNLVQLREYRAGLGAEEDKVSYWRRLAHARIDILQAEPSTPLGTSGTLSYDDLVRVLGDTGTGRARRALARVRSAEPLPDLPELSEMWSAEADLGDPAEADKAARRLRVAEHKLSSYRRCLHKRSDDAASELILRYREDPGVALSAIPRD